MTVPVATFAGILVGAVIDGNVTTQADQHPTVDGVGDLRGSAVGGQRLGAQDALGQFALAAVQAHDAVFDRVERHHHQPSARTQ